MDSSIERTGGLFIGLTAHSGRHACNAYTELMLSFLDTQTAAMRHCHTFYSRSSRHESTCLSQAYGFNNDVTKKNCECNKEYLRL